MPVLRIQGFSGVVPVSGDRALPDGYAVESVNTWLYGKELRGMRPPLEHTPCDPATRTVLRIPRRTSGGNPSTPSVVPPPSYLQDSVWVEFTDPYTDIVKGMLVEDQYERWYFCSPTTGLRFNTYDNMKNEVWPLTYGYRVGVPAVPTTAAPTITPSGGTVPTETRVYCYTWVNTYGEEGPPSPPATYSGGNTNANWDIANILDPTTEFANYAPFLKKRLYRSITGASGQTTYYRVVELNPGVTTYRDTMTPAVLAGNLKLESTSWLPPPTSLKGIIGMPNGFLIGWDKNNIFMSDSYHFHAWPPEFKQAVETPVVGLGILGQTCVVCTEGHPATVSGSKPATCSFTKSTTGEPCLSRGSIVSTPSGVVYASQNGLILVGPGGIQNVTKDVITRDDWIRDYAPQYIKAQRYQEGYLALRMTPTSSPPVARSAFYLDPTELRVALTEISDQEGALSYNTDFWSGEVFIIQTGGKILRWDPPPTVPATFQLPVLWKSKEFQFPYQENFGAYAIYWDDARYSQNDYGTSIMPSNEKVRFRVWADRKVVYDQPVAKNGRGIRLPSGYKADIWQFEIKARAPVYSLHVASTMKELRQV